MSGGGDVLMDLREIHAVGVFFPEAVEIGHGLGLVGLGFGGS